MQKTVKVNRITQSPLNRVRWHVSLDCGYQYWLNSKRRPMALRAACAQCEAKP